MIEIRTRSRFVFFCRRTRLRRRLAASLYLREYIRPFIRPSSVYRGTSLFLAQLSEILRLTEWRYPSCIEFDREPAITQILFWNDNILKVQSRMPHGGCNKERAINCGMWINGRGGATRGDYVDWTDAREIDCFRCHRLDLLPPPSYSLVMSVLTKLRKLNVIN